MMKTTEPSVRQLEKLLHEKILVWAKSDAPLILLDAPPLSSFKITTRERVRAPLAATTSPSRYPQVLRWREQKLNSISVATLGCVFEGEADYRVHSRPGEAGREWVVPVQAGTLFAIAPNAPFSDGGKIAWERPAPKAAFSRGILMHLRRDGVSCHTFTCKNNKLWVHPYVFLHESEAWALGEKLIAEMREQFGAPVSGWEYSQPETGVSHLYWQLILHLLLRTIARGEYSALQSPTDSLLARGDEIPLAAKLPPRRVVRAATQYIKTHLGEKQLTGRAVAGAIGYSERHLNRLFENELQASVFDFIQQERSEKARDLLAHSEIPIREIAAYCGFGSAAVFSTWFLRTHGESPSQYRSNLQQKNLQRRKMDVVNSKTMS